MNDLRNIQQWAIDNAYRHFIQHRHSPGYEVTNPVCYESFFFEPIHRRIIGCGQGEKGPCIVVFLAQILNGRRLVGDDITYQAERILMNHGMPRWFFSDLVEAHDNAVEEAAERNGHRSVRGFGRLFAEELRRLCAVHDLIFPGDRTAINPGVAA